EKWANSSERLSIQNKIDKLIGSKTEYRAYQH
ncbi:MAG: antibiotic biosynthesis monooxygenase, partial [Desulfobacterales bacterium CG23_combo_of_CG06-09_8_20_14_all_52_9]